MNRLTAIITVLTLLLISCGEKERVIVPVPTDCPPAAPRNVYSVNLDGSVLICWLANSEDDVEGYDVYRGEDYYGEYYYIGTVLVEGSTQIEFCFEDVRPNGDQFFYAVTAYDFGDLESDLSYEEVTGTPRPEGILALNDYETSPETSGYDLSGLTNLPQRYNLSTTDIFFFGSPEICMIEAWRPNVELQDYGYVTDFDVINYAPTEGWSPSRTVEAIVSHCYIVRLLETDGYHYAKLYVTAVNESYVIFQWAYQIDAENRDLAPAAPGSGTEITDSSSSRSLMPGPTESITSLAERSAIPPIVERVAWTQDDESAQRTTE